MAGTTKRPSRASEGRTMIKIWGRNTSVNVQKVMWAVGELELPHERIDVGGAFGKNKEPAYLAMNPNGLVPTPEEDDGFLLWESNSIVRSLAAKYGAGKLEPADMHSRARASSWMDWQLTVAHPPLTPVFWGLIRTPPEKRDHAAIEAGKVKCIAAMKILDAQLAKTAFVAGDTLSMADIPLALMAYPFRLPLPPPGAGAAGARPSRALVRRHRAAPRVQATRAGDSVRVRAVRAFDGYNASPRRSFGTSPTRPAASRMNRCFSAGRRSTRPRPTSRTRRNTSDWLENSRLSPSVAIPMAMVSKRRQR